MQKNTKIDFFKIDTLNNVWILLLTCAFFFVFSNMESLAALYGIQINLGLTTTILKSIREFLILIISLIIYQKFTNKKNQIINFIFVTLLVLCSLQSGLYNIFWGLRFFIPLLFLLTPFDSFKITHRPSNIQKFITILLITHVALQLVHLFFGIGVWAFFPFGGINARNSGLLYYPASSAFLTLALFVFSYCIDGKIRNLFLVALSIFLCSSIMGLVTFMCTLLLLQTKLLRRQKIVFFIYFIISFVVLHFARHTNDGKLYLDQTAGVRAHIFTNSVQEMKFSLVNSDFGKATNGAAKHTNGVIVDSLYSALVANLGAIWSSLLIILLIYYVYLQRQVFKNLKSRLILCVFSLGGIGLIVSEVTFPFLLIIFAKALSTKEES